MKISTINVLLIVAAIAAIGFAFWYFFMKDESAPGGSTKSTEPGQGSGGGAGGAGGSGGGGTAGGNQQSGTKIVFGKNYSYEDIDKPLSSLSGSFSVMGLITQAVLNDVSNAGLVVDGYAGKKTKAAITAFWKNKKEDWEDQSLGDLLVSAGKNRSFIPSILNNQAANIKKGTKGKYYV